MYYAYIISQEVPTLSGGTFVKLTGVVLHYQALTLSGVFFITLLRSVIITLSAGTAVTARSVIITLSAGTAVTALNWHPSVLC